MIEPASWGGFVVGSAGGHFAYPVALTPDEAAPRGRPGGGDPAPQPAPEGSGTATEAKATLLEAIRAARESDGEAEPIEALGVPAGLVEKARGKLRRARRKLENLKRQGDEAPDPAAVRAMGSLLLARLSEIPGRTGRVTTTDFDGHRVEIDLDPALSPIDNANRFFQEAARAERAGEALPGLMREAERDIERWGRGGGRSPKGGGRPRCLPGRAGRRRAVAGRSGPARERPPLPEIREFGRPRDPGGPKRPGKRRSDLPPLASERHLDARAAEPGRPRDPPAGTATEGRRAATWPRVPLSPPCTPPPGTRSGSPSPGHAGSTSGNLAAHRRGAWYRGGYRPSS